MNEEKEQLSPISILECTFQDDVVTPHSHQKGKFTDDLLEYSIIGYNVIACVLSMYHIM